MESEARAAEVTEKERAAAEVAEEKARADLKAALDQLSAGRHRRLRITRGRRLLPPTRSDRRSCETGGPWSVDGQARGHECLPSRGSSSVGGTRRCLGDFCLTIRVLALRVLWPRLPAGDQFFTVNFRAPVQVPECVNLWKSIAGRCLAREGRPPTDFRHSRMVCGSCLGGKRFGLYGCHVRQLEIQTCYNFFWVPTTPPCAGVLLLCVDRIGCAV